MRGSVENSWEEDLVLYKKQTHACVFALGQKTGSFT